MKKLLLFLFTFGLLISTSATAEIVLYCNDELATGFTKKNGNGIWRTTNFNLERYTIKFSDDYSEVKGVDTLGAKYSWQCTNILNNEKYNTVRCISDLNDGESFTYHKNTKRFIISRGAIFGFIDNGTDDNGIKAGTCQKF